MRLVLPALCLLTTLLACGQADPAHEASRDLPSSPQPEEIDALQTRERRPNVILIVIDTLRRDHLGAYGYPRNTSPRIDAFAAGAVRYAKAHTQAPWTTPAIGALLSSQYPTALGIQSERSILSDELLLLPELLAQHGFATGAVVSHDFCSSKYNFDQGFEAFDESQILGLEGITSPEITRRGLAFVEQHREHPFFLWLHYFDPHWAYRAHPEFEFDADSDYRGRVKGVELMFQLLQLAPELEPADLAELERRYDSEIAFTDHHVGAFLDGLRELGLFDDSLIVLVADHGEEFKDHGSVGHAHSLHAELIDIPLIVHYPGGRSALNRDPVAIIDVFPTVLEVLGLEAPGPLAGRPLPRGDGRTLDAPRIVFSETMRFAKQRAAIAGRWKLILDLESGDYRLFDLERDPGEQKDRYAELGDEHRALVDALAHWSAESDAGARIAKEIDLSPEEIERLRALGYGD